EYLAVSSLSWAVSDPFRQLGQLLNDLQHFFASAMKLMNILGARPRVTSPERPERTERAGSGADAAGAPTGAEAGIAGGSVAAGADASDATAVATEIRGRATTETEAEPATAAADIANAAGTPAEAESAAATANAGGAPAITDAAAAETGAESAAADIAAAAAAAETGGASARAVAAGGEIEFRDVSFGFAGTPVLNGVSFHIRPGETYALMGETGSGKTVIADLISRFYDVQSGAVIVDGTDVRKWDLQALRGMIGMTTQETFLFSDTVDGNIAYGNPSLPESEVRKYAAASAAQFIEKLSEGYETIIGERGVGLSGGQKQRIALARALAIHPGILILDDTTSAVDMETEKYIQEQLEALDFPCTKLVIAQRISSVKNADCILLLHGGAIAERGTHAELIAKNGRYRDLWKIQTGVAELAGDIADLASGAAELAGDMADPGGCGAELTGAANPTDPATPANPARTANPVSSADPAPTADPMNPPSSANPARPADPASPAVPARPAKGGG
ncbi:MAG: ATP-binding cassette domain-containing protein, partial [Clostridiales bacterium]|nr:ATP-binding cassette domain-containing protein [Clostridiales bacterium]